ncbi:MAG TPA: PAS domain S-box protein [Anaerolineaceae bacterium]|nr:PAS domain S-box protein [Anaerolineaceae bacterium]
MQEKPRVLMIEDNPDQALVIQEYLKLDAKFEVDWANSIKAFWEHIAKNKYDILLMDYRLPDGTGLDALKELPKRGYRLPVIMVTGQGDEEIAAQTIRQGADDYVVKSGNYFIKLPALIRKVLKEFELELSVERSLEKIRYQAILLDNVRDAVVVWDTSGRINYWNSAAEILLDWQPNQMAGASVTQDYYPLFSPPLDWKTVEKCLNADIERRIAKNGHEDVWISSKITCLTGDAPENKLIGYMDVIRDITHRKKAEEERRKLSSVVQQTADSVIITNKDGLIEYVNPAFEKLTGYTLEEALGKDLSLISDPQPDDHLEKTLWQTVLAGESFRSVFIRIKKNGEQFYSEEIITPLRDAQGAIDHLVLNSRDITERRRMENQIQAAMIQLTESARLAAIGELSTGIAHRINNPLTTIIAEAQLLRREISPEHPFYDPISDIEKAGWKAQEVVGKLLEFSKPATNAFEVLSINQTIQSALVLVGAQLQSNNVEVNLELENGLPSILGNARQIEDLWVNLLLLARDATADGQPHSIQIRSCSAPKAMIKVTFKDDGKEIPADQLARIFEPTLIGYDINRGTGIEFTICQEIVRQHKGTIRAESNPNATTITIYMPVFVAEHSQLINLSLHENG